jgi:hypothetical protein
MVQLGEYKHCFWYGLLRKVSAHLLMCQQVYMGTNPLVSYYRQTEYLCAMPISLPTA